ncbi:MAG: 23S rRNA (adenine(2030)-N(6))-methyltransferase RlmJ [Methylobacteriaceae bacterium]|nr:23S rRNA (adenine(2030)-N(6))-methyltransferase RlmJ [Methylobacteriaceae bacterium]
MNYRHGFHAGNFADVFKHVFLTRILAYLARKGTPFRVIDTHAGAGEYDLASEEAVRGGEWQDGIGRLADAGDLDVRARELLRPYLEIVGPLRADGPPARYPGSPRIVQAMMRGQDRVTFCELHPQTFADLRANFRRDARIACLNLDGYIGLNAGVPPKERRGLVLIDPPFERTDEFDAALNALRSAHEKWPTGTYALWYPVKDASAIARFATAIVESGIRRVLRLELAVEAPLAGGKLARAGLILINPPYVLEEEAAILMPALARKLARTAQTGILREWLAGE